jgi:hypothetical protein
MTLIGDLPLTDAEDELFRREVQLHAAVRGDLNDYLAVARAFEPYESFVPEKGGPQYEPTNAI